MPFKSDEISHGTKADIQPDHCLSAHYFNLFVTKIEQRSKTLTLTKRFELRQPLSLILHMTNSQQLMGPVNSARRTRSFESL